MNQKHLNCPVQREHRRAGNGHFLPLTHCHQRAEEADRISQGLAADIWPFPAPLPHSPPPPPPRPAPYVPEAAEQGFSKPGLHRPCVFESLERFAKDQTPGVYPMSPREPGIFPILQALGVDFGLPQHLRALERGTFKSVSHVSEP